MQSVIMCIRAVTNANKVSKSQQHTLTLCFFRYFFVKYFRYLWSEWAEACVFVCVEESTEVQMTQSSRERLAC